MNKVETKVDARLDMNAATWLSHKVRRKLEEKVRDSAGGGVRCQRNRAVHRRL